MWFLQDLKKKIDIKCLHPYCNYKNCKYNLLFYVHNLAVLLLVHVSIVLWKTPDTVLTHLCIK